MNKKIRTVNKVNTTRPFFYFAYLFVLWTAYRITFNFSDTIEELYIKPIIWLLPFLYLIPKDKLKLSDFGITLKNLFPSLYLSITLGVGFTLLGLITNITKYGGIDFKANIGPLFIGSSVLISFATAITEEIVFRGYLLGILLKKYSSEALAIITATVIWTLIHIPVTLFVWKLDTLQLVIYLTLTFIYGLGASIMYARTKNIAAPVFLHVLWEWPIILFR